MSDIYDQPFAIVPDSLLFAKGVSHEAKVLWVIYDLHADPQNDPEGRNRPGDEQLAEILDCSEEGVRRARHELIEAGLLTGDLDE